MVSRPRLALVDLDSPLEAALSYSLEREGAEVDVLSADEAATAGPIDVLIAAGDRGEDGGDLVAELRSELPDASIVVVDVAW